MQKQGARVSQDERLWQRVLRSLGVMSGPGFLAGLSETIVPVVNGSEILKDLKIVSATVTPATNIGKYGVLGPSLAPATNSPQWERWWPLAISAKSTGVGTINQWVVDDRRDPVGGEIFQEYDATFTSATSKWLIPSSARYLFLDPGWRFGFNVDADTSAVWTLSMLVAYEKV